MPRTTKKETLTLHFYDKYGIYDVSMNHIINTIEAGGKYGKIYSRLNNNPLGTWKLEEVIPAIIPDNKTLSCGKDD
jgi:hypothetical protein